MFHKLRRKVWELIYVQMEDLGLCDAPDRRSKKIKINKDLKGRLKLEIIIHESLHACAWDLDEEAVTETAKDISRLLYREGYRHKDE